MGLIYGNKLNRDIIITIEQDGIELDIIIPTNISSLTEDFSDPKSSKNIKLSRDNAEVELYVRSKSVGGGRAGAMSNHDASVKIVNPKDHKGVAITVPRKEDNIIIKPANVRGKDIDLAKDFVDKNRSHLRAIYHSPDDKHVTKSYKNLITQNIDIIKDIRSDSDPKIKEYFDKKKGK